MGLTTNLIRTGTALSILLLAACGGGGGGPAPPAATATLTASAANVAVNGTVTLDWTSTNATGCVASGGWSGALASSGSQTVAVPQTASYSLTCSGAGAAGTASTSVTAYSQPAPVISVDHDTVLAGSNVTVTWSAAQATACSVTGGGLSSTALSGTQSTGPVNGAVTYSIACTNPVFATPVTATAMVSVNNAVSLAVTVAAQVPGDPVVDSGTHYYVPDFAHPVALAVPFVYVAVLDSHQSVLQSTYANANGVATFTGLDATQTYTVSVQSKIKTTAAPVLDFEVVNNTGTASTSQGSFRSRYGLYAVTAGFSPSSTGSASQTLAITAPDGWDSNSSTLVAADRAAAPFVLLAYAVKEAQVVSSATGLASPTWRPLTVLWSVANKGGLTAPPNNYDQGAVTGSGGFWSSGHKAIAANGTDSGSSVIAEDYIYLSGDPSFESMDIYPFIMSHEMGHFTQSLFSTRVSMGGDHAYTDYEDFENAWIEGSASGIAALVLNTPQERRVFTSNSQLIVSIADISNNTVDGTPVAGTSSAWPVGWYQESTVADLLWSAHDSMGLTTAQALSPMFSSAWKAGPWLNSIWAYATQLKSAFSNISNSVDSFSSTHGFVTAGSNEYGLNETNNGNRTARDVLPIYNTVPVGQAQTVCSVGALLDFNKSGNNRYLRVVGDGASHTLTIHGPANTVPIISHSTSSNTTHSTTLTRTFTAASSGAIYSVGECGVAGGEFSTDTSSCGDPNPPAEQCWTITYQ